RLMGSLGGLLAGPEDRARVAAGLRRLAAEWQAPGAVPPGSAAAVEAAGLEAATDDDILRLVEAELDLS
ncbi:hypothetical protein ABT404_54935, partial [Streptomyces hyaluromycini]